MYRMIIVDDEDFTRESIVDFFDWPDMGFLMAGQFGDGSDAIDFLRREAVDLVLSDVCMCEVSGLELARYVSAHCPRAKIVMLSGYREFDYARQAMQYGAKDYLLKPVSKEELRAVLARVKAELDGERGISTAPQSPERAPEERAGAIKLAEAYIDAHLAEDLTLARIAGYVFYSESHFSREFRLTTGMSVMDYVTARRMAKAEELLKTTTLSAREVASLVGYGDDRYFLRVFRKHAGVNIRQFRQRNAAHAEHEERLS